MDIWEILGIAYTTDVKAIKRAYADRAKDCHPEERPEEFQILQAAYKMALKNAKSREASSGGTASERAVSEHADWQTTFEARSTKTSRQESNRMEGLQPAFETIQREEKPQENQDAYDFREVLDEDRQRAEQIKERVWKDVTYVIYNPFARNRQDVWEILFRRQDMGEWLQRQDSQEAFVRLICRERFAGWHRNLLAFFQGYLENLQSEEAPNRELLSEEWSWLCRNAGTELSLIASPCLTPEENKEYFTVNIHKNLELRRALGAGMSQENALYEKYLLWYLDYAAKNEERLSKSYQSWISLRKQRFEESCWMDYEKQYRYLLLNPSVRNSVSLWQCYLSRKEIRDMFRNDDACARFLWCLIANRYLRWNQSVLLYFLDYLTDLQPNGKVPPLFHSEEWTWLLKHSLKGDRQDKALVLTRKEKKVWKGLEEWNFSRDDDPGQTPEERYLTRYWKYVLLNEKSVLSLYDKESRAGHFRNNLKYYVCFIVMAALLYCGLRFLR